MYLKALEIQGFKSFPDKTRLTFEKDITAIVGPNGSGKSNISDAILWVMGEQRTKALRGGKMEDVIFGGTEKRPKMGFAQVTLVVDNTQRVFDTDSTEVAITRRYYRSGESEYYINKETVRLKDINELLMDTGLGRDGYSIIGQGRIADVVSAKSGDRRELFEEAAGISRYRYRKDESERKLEHTQENLVRINDKIDELKIQVDPLKQQAETAKKYLVLRDELRALEVSVWMETLDKLHENAAGISEAWEQAKRDLEQAKEKLQELYDATENFSEKMREKDLEAESTRTRLGETEALCADNESEIAVLENSMGHNAERKSQLEAELEEQGGRALALQAQIEKHQARIEEIKTELSRQDEQMRAVMESMNSNAQGEDEARREITRLYGEKSEKQSELSRCNTVLSMLKEAAAEQEQQASSRATELFKAQERHSELQSQLQSEKRTLSEAEEKVNGLNNIIEGYSMRIQGRESKVKTLDEQKTKLTIELNSAQSRINMLSEMEKEFEGYSKSVKTVMRESEHGTLKGVHGPVANLVKTDDRFALAIETALGGSMQSIVVDTQEQGKAAIEMLKRKDGGRATFLPINTIKPYDLKRRPDGEAGYLGTAYELCSFDKKFSDIFSNLLSRTVVAESLSDAIAMSKRFDNQLRIVTLDGQLINAGGSMTGGSAAKNAGILSRANELKALQQKQEELSAKTKDCVAALSEAERELASARYELQTADFELKEASELLRQSRSAAENTEFLVGEAEKAVTAMERDGENAALRKAENAKRAEETNENAKRLTEEIGKLDAELSKLSAKGEEYDRMGRELSEKLTAISEKRSSLASESDTTVNAIAQLQELFADLSGDGETRRRAIESLGAENAALSEKIAQIKAKLDENRAKAESIKAELTAINNMKLELEGKRTQNEKNAQDKNKELLDLEHQCSAFEQKKLAADMEEKQIIDKLWDSYELSRTAAQAVREPVESMSASTKRIGSLKREIGALGNPNLGAIEEYELQLPYRAARRR